MGVTVYLSHIVAQFLQKHKSWGKEVFGQSANRPLPGPSFLLVDKISSIASACLSIRSQSVSEKERLLFPLAKCGIHGKSGLSPNFSLINKMVSLPDNFTPLPLILAQQYNHLHCHDCSHCYNHRSQTPTPNPNPQSGSPPLSSVSSPPSVTPSLKTTLRAAPTATMSNGVTVTTFIEFST